jgi:hypothetical protein
MKRHRSIVAKAHDWTAVRPDLSMTDIEQSRAVDGYYLSSGAVRIAVAHEVGVTRFRRVVPADRATYGQPRRSWTSTPGRDFWKASRTRSHRTDAATTRRSAAAGSHPRRGCGGRLDQAHHRYHDPTTVAVNLGDRLATSTEPAANALMRTRPGQGSSRRRSVQAERGAYLRPLLRRHLCFSVGELAAEPGARFCPLCLSGGAHHGRFLPLRHDSARTERRTRPRAAATIGKIKRALPVSVPKRENA